MDWKEDDVESPSTDDSWPWKEYVQNGENSSKIVKFVHEEFPLERPPIICRLMVDTVPTSSIDDQKQSIRTTKTTDIYNGDSNDLEGGKTSFGRWSRHRFYAVSRHRSDTIEYHSCHNIGSSHANMEEDSPDERKHVLSSLVSWWTHSSSSRFLRLKNKITPYSN